MAEVRLKEIKNWGPETELKITERWRKAEQFRFDPKTKKKVYSIDTPPPYINSPVHMGHAVTYSFMDFFARYRRMKGFEVLFPLGLDRNGLPIEMGTEKKFNVSPFIVGREKFVEYCEKLLDETTAESTDTFSKLGISFSSYEEGKHIGSIYLTDSPEYRALTQSTFIDLYKKGLVYEDKRINNWDPKLRTTIADSEIEYRDLPSMFNDVLFKVKETGEQIKIGTTRPELICTCGMIIFHPEDKRYKNLNGKTAVTPIFEKEVLIKAHPLAQMDKGTGLAMMCSAGDLSDIQFFREMSLKPVIAISKDGTMNENAGFLKGLKVREARERIVEELRNKNLLVEQARISHRTPISERSGAEIEFIEMPEFYLKQIEFKNDLKKIIKKINFYPKESVKLLEDWIDSISIDWPISRRRYYATPIPLWYSDELTAVPPQGKYYQPWKESPPKDADVLKNKKVIGKVSDFKGKKWKGEERVFDTWFDSSISELFVIRYKSDMDFFKKTYPVTLRPQGKEIVRTWLYYTILRGYLETGKQCFEDVWIHQHILDEKGRKMSKSAGNAIDPQELLKNYGAEALRLWAATEGDLSKGDFICSREKINAELKTINKLLNVTKFIMQFEKPKKPKLKETDRLFIDYAENLTKETDEQYGNYDFHHPTVALRRFLWDIFASHYLELVKNRAYNQDNKFAKEESESAKFALHYLLERILILLYPIIPQVTSLIANEKGIDLHQEEFPKAEKGKSELNLVDKIMQFDGVMWKAKKDKGLSLRAEVKHAVLPSELKPMADDIKSAHNISSLEFGDNIKIELEA
nr:isoleucine--tRNA ligase [uncultured archaeon]